MRVEIVSPTLPGSFSSRIMRIPPDRRTSIKLEIGKGGLRNTYGERRTREELMPFEVVELHFGA